MIELCDYKDRTHRFSFSEDIINLSDYLKELYKARTDATEAIPLFSYKPEAWNLFLEWYEECKIYGLNNGLYRDVCVVTPPAFKTAEFRELTSLFHFAGDNYMFSLFESVAREILTRPQAKTLNKVLGYRMELYRSRTNPERPAKILYYTLDDEGDSLIEVSPHAIEFHPPSCVRYIAQDVFVGHNNLRVLEFPAGVKDIEDRACMGCRSLTDVIIPDSVEEVGDMAFIGCRELVNVRLGNSVRHIGTAAFAGCAKLSTIALPASTRHVLPIAFERCENLVSITVPRSIKSIGICCFSRCNKLKSSIREDLVTRYGGYILETYVPERHDDAIF